MIGHTTRDERDMIWLVVFDGPSGQFVDGEGLSRLQALAPDSVQVRAMSLLDDRNAASDRVPPNLSDSGLKGAVGERTDQVADHPILALHDASGWREMETADVLIAEASVLLAVEHRWRALGTVRSSDVGVVLLDTESVVSLIYRAARMNQLVLVDTPTAVSGILAGGRGRMDGDAGSPWVLPWVLTVESLPGEGLIDMGARLGVPWQEVAELNDISATRLIQPGTRLRIPYSDDGADVHDIGRRAADIGAGKEGPRVDEDVQFTVYKPPAISPDVWYSMLAFAHKTELVEQPDGTVPDPTAEVQKKAAGVLGAQLDEYTKLAADATGPVPKGDEIRFVPEVPEIEFNPPVAAVRWEEPVHMCEFRLKAEPGVGVKHLRGSMSVYLGPLLIGRVSLSFGIGEGVSPERTRRVAKAGHRYRKIFPSYSHRDTEIVEEIKRAVETLGDRYTQDVVALRSGEEWHSRLEHLIEEAHVFQLFWSSNSMRSEFVRREWTHALSLNRSGFVRPLYWELPRPESRGDGLPPPDLDRIHFSVLPGTMVAASNVRCPSCENANPVAARFCFQCGFALIATSPTHSPADRAAGQRPPEEPEPNQVQVQRQQSQRMQQAGWYIDRTGERRPVPDASASLGLGWIVGVALLILAVVIAVITLLVR